MRCILTSEGKLTTIIEGEARTFHNKNKLKKYDHKTKST